MAHECIDTAIPTSGSKWLCSRREEAQQQDLNSGTGRLFTSADQVNKGLAGCCLKNQLCVFSVCQWLCLQASGVNRGEGQLTKCLGE